MCPERVNNPRDQPQKEALLLSSCGRPFTISSHCQLHPLNNEQDTILRVSKIEKFTWHRDLTHSEINFTRLCENHVINRLIVFETILCRLGGFWAGWRNFCAEWSDFLWIFVPLNKKRVFFFVHWIFYLPKVRIGSWWNGRHNKFKTDYFALFTFYWREVAFVMLISWRRLYGYG